MLINRPSNPMLLRGSPQTDVGVITLWAKATSCALRAPPKAAPRGIFEKISKKSALGGGGRDAKFRMSLQAHAPEGSPWQGFLGPIFNGRRKFPGVGGRVGDWRPRPKT